MTEPTRTPEPTERDNPSSGMVRQTVDLIVVLCLGVLLFRTFSAEAYVVPTGSMAPTLLGHHRELNCTNCGFTFVLGIDDEGHRGSAVCPNCGQAGLDNEPAVDCNGDRVLVQKFLYEFRRPRRWEVAVFHFPGEPTQAYVKRVVALPHEAVQISRGDVMVNGKLARKSLQEQRAMRILVHDSRFVPKDAARYPRWVFRRGNAQRILPSGWIQTDGGFTHLPPPDAASSDPEDWLLYRHWDPAHHRYGPIRDHYAYNGGDLDSGNAVSDLAFEARLDVTADVDSIAVLFRSGGDRFVVRIPVHDRGELEVVRNRRKQAVTLLANPLSLAGPWPRRVRFEASVFDRRLIVAVDGRPLFEPLDYDDLASGPPQDESPLGFGVRGGTLSVHDLKIYRDVYYTNALGGIPRHPHGVDTPYQLGEDEYFVLGDNSPVSNDSRFWAGSPVVPGSMFLGKPFLVHLPGEVVALEVFGRSIYWVPDPRKIRYIH